MRIEAVLWDLDDDPDGNVQHCADHGVTKEEVEEVLESAKDADISRSTGRPVVFGDTLSGRHLMVVYESINARICLPGVAPSGRVSLDTRSLGTAGRLARASR
jgi:uncharacterized DUF497 family protein